MNHNWDVQLSTETFLIVVDDRSDFTFIVVDVVLIGLKNFVWLEVNVSYGDEDESDRTAGDNEQMKKKTERRLVSLHHLGQMDIEGRLR